MKEENKTKYDKFMNEQFRILQGHFSRCMLRCYNYYNKLEGEKIMRDKE